MPAHDEAEHSQIYGLLGCKIGYSLSPLIFNSLFRATRQTAVYQLFDIEPRHISEFVSAVRLLPISAFNVTIPYKEVIADHLDRLDRTSRIVGAVNLVINRKGNLIGHNTDLDGVAVSIERGLNLSVADKQVVVIGSGGACRAVYYYLVQHKAAQIRVYHHSRKRRGAFESYVSQLPRKDRYSGADFKERIDETEPCDLCVNCTPVPSRRLLTRNSHAKAEHIFDMVYSDTVDMANKKSIDGKLMLAVQAAEGFAMMTGREADVGAIVKLIRRATKELS
jgi:shikimate dehydrogenase